jgi:aminoglycoside 6'-N-acetyltransferase I
MDKKIKIERIASIEMLEECVELFMEAYNCAPWNDNWTRGTAIALLTCYYNTPKFVGLMAKSGNMIIGCGIGNIEPHYSGNVFYLRELFVSVQSQKAGVGRRLIAALKEDLQLMGIKTIILFTGKTIFDFYIKSGFKEMEGMGMMVYSDKDNYTNCQS